MSNNPPPVYVGQCRGGPLDGMLLTSGTPRRTFAKPVEPQVVGYDPSKPPDVNVTMNVTGYYDYDYADRAFIWTDA